MKIFRKALIATALGASLIAAGPAAAVSAPPSPLSNGDLALQTVTGSSFDNLFSFSLTNPGDLTIAATSTSMTINFANVATFTLPAVTFTGWDFFADNHAKYSSAGTSHTWSANSFTFVAKDLDPGNYVFELFGTTGAISANARSTLTSSGMGLGMYGVVAIAESVPEPGEWAMMLAGLGMVGAMIRRRITK